ncbi:uncharacterized protein [Triticum aestivum]|uniref:uncharacterized protein isoform X1 n=1 Tax=Triticum aestivum TaxID=4565 RepID=UPI001D00FE6B|nr:uncharacterized protein LOC123052634 isoform X1 [Triticum aestivum]
MCGFMLTRRDLGRSLAPLEIRCGAPLVHPLFTGGSRSGGASSSPICEWAFGCRRFMRRGEGAMEGGASSTCPAVVRRRERSVARWLTWPSVIHSRGLALFGGVGRGGLFQFIGYFSEPAVLLGPAVWWCCFLLYMVIFRATAWIRTWSLLTPMDSREPLVTGCNQWEMVARVIFNRFGWRSHNRIGVQRAYPYYYRSRRICLKVLSIEHLCT